MKPILQHTTGNWRQTVRFLFAILFMTGILTGCQNSSSGPVTLSKLVSPSEKEEADWKKEFREKLPLFGHRNWIVVTDMAYPLQTRPGITTLYTNDSYGEVLTFVTQTLREAQHIYPHVYQDREFDLLTEEICPGIDSVRTVIGPLLSAGKVEFREHESLIATLDSVSRLFQVLVLKTDLTIPYSSVFFELDCKYWNAAQQGALEKRAGR